MESFDEARKWWKESKDKEAAPTPLTRASLEDTVKARVRKERNVVMEYFWAAFVYHNLIYGFAAYLIVSRWGDVSVTLWSLAGTVLYIPVTIVLIRKFRAMVPTVNKNNSGLQPIRANVENHYARLSEFFRFKRGFDWIGIPLSGFIVVMLLFKLYSKEGIQEHPVGGIILFVTVITAFIAATYFENRKRFIRPLHNLELVLKDLKGGD